MVLSLAFHKFRATKIEGKAENHPQATLRERTLPFGCLGRLWLDSGLGPGVTSRERPQILWGGRGKAVSLVSPPRKSGTLGGALKMAG